MSTGMDSRPSGRSAAILAVTLAAGLTLPAASARAKDGMPEITSYACSNVTNSGPDYSASNPDGQPATVSQDFSGEDLDLRHANFSGADLRGSTFEGQDLTGANFTGAILGPDETGRPTSFSNTDLTDACFDQVEILGNPDGPLPAEQPDFQFAQFQCTALTRTDLRQADFGPASEPIADAGPVAISGSDPAANCRTSFAGTLMTCGFVDQWAGMDLSYADIDACADDLAGQDFAGAIMTGVEFFYMDLSGSDFSGATLDNANLYAATLTNAVFTGADLRYATLSSVEASQAVFNEQAQLSGASLAYGNFEAASFRTAVLQEADGVPAASLSFANLHNADFTDAAMEAVNLSGALLYDGSLIKSASIQNSNLSNATLTSLDLSSANLSGVVFDYSNLINASLAGANLRAVGGDRAASLVKTNLQGVDLSDAQLQGINMTNAAVATEHGVPLFSINDDVDGLTDDLRTGNMTAELASAFENAGYALNPCVAPGIDVLDSTIGRWALRAEQRVGPPGQVYRAFALQAQRGDGPAMTGMSVAGLDSEGVSSDPLFTIDGDFLQALNDRDVPRAVFSGFRSNRYALPRCSNPRIVSGVGPESWAIETPLAQTTTEVVGYTGFNIRGQDDGTLRVYGTQVTSVFQNDDGQLRFSVTSVTPTRIDASSFSNESICPNGVTYAANLAAGLSFEDMMTAPSPPPPPSCEPGSVMCR